MHSPFEVWSCLDLRRHHLRLLYDRDGDQDGWHGRLWQGLLPVGNLESTGLLHRSGRVSRLVATIQEQVDPILQICFRALEYCLDVEKLNLTAIRTVRVLRPLRAINRIPSEYALIIYQLSIRVFILES